MVDAPAIPFNRPSFGPAAMDHLAAVMRSGQTCGDRAVSRRCEAVLAEITGSPRVFLTPSCTAALEMSALLLGVGPGDEVIVPSYTFTSSANAFALLGARPVFVDSAPDTLNLDAAKLDALVTPRTRAIVAMHYAGVGCDMDAVADIARRRGVAVVEDNAHGLMGALDGKALGSFGLMSTASFHETKNLACGEGGALFVNDPALIERAEMVREKGTNRGRFLRGEVDKYSWVDRGSSWLLPDLLAAVLLDQLERRREIQAARAACWESYARELSSWAAGHGVRLPTIAPGVEHPSHLFWLTLPSEGTATAFIAHLRARGVSSVRHYVPLHLSDMGRRFGGREGDCPVVEDLAARLVRLPLYATITAEETARVIDACLGFRP